MNEFDYDVNKYFTTPFTRHIDPGTAILGSSALMTAGGLLGGGDSGSSGQVSTLIPGQRRSLDAVTAAFLNQVFPGYMETLPRVLQRKYGTIPEMATADVYSGQRVADISPLQESAFNMYRNIPQQFQKYNQLAGNTMQNLLAPTETAADYWQKAFVAPGMDVWKDVQTSIINALPEGGVRSSGAMDVLGKRGKEFGTALTGQLAQAMENRRGLQLQALPELARMSLLPADIASNLFSAGSAQRGISQEKLNAAQQMWSESQPYNNPYLNTMYGNIMGVQATSPYYQQGSPGYSTMLPAAANMLGSYLGMQGASGTNIGTPATPTNYNSLTPFQQDMWRSMM